MFSLPQTSTFHSTLLYQTVRMCGDLTCSNSNRQQRLTFFKRKIKLWNVQIFYENGRGPSQLWKTFKKLLVVIVLPKEAWWEEQQCMHTGSLCLSHQLPLTDAIRFPPQKEQTHRMEQGGGGVTCMNARIQSRSLSPVSSLV